MKRSEFQEFCGRLFDLAAGANVPASLPSGGGGRAPKYETRVRVKDGYKLSSEMDLKDLTWWASTMAERAAKPGSKHAEKDAKDAKYLAQWRDWRRNNPTAVWTGERDHEVVTVPAPVDRAPVHAWKPKQTDPQPGAAFADEPDESPVDDPRELEAEATTRDEFGY